MDSEGRIRRGHQILKILFASLRRLVIAGMKCERGRRKREGKRVDGERGSECRDVSKGGEDGVAGGILRVCDLEGSSPA